MKTLWRFVSAAALAATGLTASAPGIVHAAGLSVNDLNHGVTATDLANALVGSGVTASNVHYAGSPRAAGKFTGGTGIIGFESGIVMSSGKVQTVAGDPACSRGVEGPNNCHEGTGSVPPGADGGANSTNFGLPGDPRLTALSGFPTFDASILEFDIVPSFSTVQFKYVFSSEEYSDFSNTEFNDVFAFDVNGVNCALVPGTTQPVSINTINNGNDVGGDPTPHHPELFIDNVRPAGPHLDTQMDGLTVVLTCNATVNPGVTNHMRLAIADASDGILDSAVFIQGSSLVSGTQISTTQKSGTQSGANITVNAPAVVTDSSTLTGVNAPTATGTVNYKVFSDAACTTLFADAGTKTVAAGTVPDSNPVTFTAAGIFYWQAAYSGDAANNPSTSKCGDEVLTVKSMVVTPHSLALNGIDGYAEAAHTADLNITGNWTVETWFKDEDPGGFNHDFRQIINKGDRNSNPESPYYILIGNNHLLAGVRSGGVDHPIDADLSFLGLDPSKWHHVAVTYRADLQVVNLWLDGAHISYLTDVPNSAGNTLPVEIGRNGPTSGKYWMGKLDDTRIWNIARSGADITATFMTEFMAPPPANLVANWQYNESSGTTASDFADSHTATLHGGASFSTDVHP